MKPRQVIESALGEQLAIDLLPAARPREVDELERELGRRVPPDVRDLLSLTTGFEFAPVGSVDFLGRDMSVETFFRSVPILADHYGNFWVVDAEPVSGEWGPVLFWCHDPAVLVVQAATLGDFLEQIFDLGRPVNRDALNAVREEHSAEIARDDPHLISAEQARRSSEPIVAAFAADLPDSAYVADLRGADVGMGLSWGGRYSDLTRHGGELLFGVRRTSRMGRLFRRS
jgi:hypothetical protein